MSSVTFIIIVHRIILGETEEAQEYLKKFTSSKQALIRMRGLPYSVTTEQIVSHGILIPVY